MDDLIIMQKNDIYTTTLIISENLEMKHEHIIKILKKYENIEILSRLEIRKLATKGRAIVNYLLTEEQALLLVSMMRNTPKVIEFKIKLVRAFIHYRKLASQLLSQKQNVAWIEKRQDTKVMRQECTDVIQEFVAYAKEQGSKSADHYYSNLSRMELSGLFILEKKYPNARDVMSMRQLNLIEMADEAVAVSLRESMDNGLPYKECYQEAKKRIELLAKIIPRSPLPALLRDSKATCELETKEIEVS